MARIIVVRISLVDSLKDFNKSTHQRLKYEEGHAVKSF